MNVVILETATAGDPSQETAMYGTYEGLPPAASVQQAVRLAQLEILRRLERQRTGTGTPSVP
jgi:hypothetical protein